MPLFGRVHEYKKYDQWSEKESVNSEWNEVNSTEEQMRPPKGHKWNHELAQADRQTQRL